MRSLEYSCTTVSAPCPGPLVLGDLVGKYQVRLVGSSIPAQTPIRLRDSLPSNLA